MRKTILIILGSIALAASAVQFAAAAERHHVQRAQRAPAPAHQTFRDSNAWAHRRDAWANPYYAQPDWKRYEDGALSAPAGH
jgi:hypothetical protein